MNIYIFEVTDWNDPVC